MLLYIAQSVMERAILILIRYDFHEKIFHLFTIEKSFSLYFLIAKILFKIKLKNFFNYAQ